MTPTTRSILAVCYSGLALMGLAAIAGATGCSSSPSSEAAGDISSTSEAVQTLVKARLWILNRKGNPPLADFFTCLLGETTWNDLAIRFPTPETVTFGAEAFVSGSACNPSGPLDQPSFQCAVTTGGFDVSPYDIVLIIRDDDAAGGQNNSTGAISVKNPVTGATVPINTGEIGNGTLYNTQDYLYVYAGHEVFEAQTDGVSGDCCDGETASGGQFNWCSACGGPTGGCGRHQGDLGITHITCPSGHTYRYQTVSPPGAYVYGSPEFNGTCDVFMVKPAIPDAGKESGPAADAAHGPPGADAASIESDGAPSLEIEASVDEGAAPASAATGGDGGDAAAPTGEASATGSPSGCVVANVGRARERDATRVSVGALLIGVVVAVGRRRRSRGVLPQARGRIVVAPASVERCSTFGSAVTSGKPSRAASHT